MKLANIFRDNMVLQANKPNLIYGFNAKKTDKIDILFNNKTYKCNIKSDGFFYAKLDPLKASYKQYKMIIKINNKVIEIKNIHIGEVWLIGGQSNIDCRLGLLIEYRVGNKKYPKTKEEVYQGKTKYNNTVFKDYALMENYKNIYCYTVGFTSSRFKLREDSKLDDSCKTGWVNPNNINESLYISGYALGFALNLQKELNVPVGIVVSSVGGSSIEEWISKEYFRKYNLHSHYWGKNKFKSHFYNGMFNPIKYISINGFLWYQGEADAGFSNDEKSLEWINDYKKDMIVLSKQIRDTYGNDITIISQQIAQYNEWIKLRFMRNLQYNLKKDISNYYVVSGIGAGIPFDDYPVVEVSNLIHPGDKFKLTKNAANIALSYTYNKKGYDKEAPYPLGFNKIKNGYEIVFDTKSNLYLSSNKYVNNLEALVDGNWITIENALINKNKIIVNTNKVIKSFRYAQYNNMMKDATKKDSKTWEFTKGFNYEVHPEFNSEKEINLYSKGINQELAVFPFEI